MSDSKSDFNRHIREIKWILLGILICLALIVLTRIPDLIIVGLIAVALCMVGWLVYMAWPAFRRLVDDMMSRSRSAWDRDADL
ncbi:MAG: hypothetical protein CMJ18_04065 [Phycisphaeraceae bacterium]|nr:hypothetical protein [Phycisphaeraceae bacterium]